MFKSFLFSAVFGFTLFGSFGVTAHAQSNVSATASDSGGQFMVDRVAADFFENSMRQSQSKRVQAETAAIYQNMGEAERAAFRERRRAMWQAMSEAEKMSLRDAKTPRYLNLTEEQKRPFRDIAQSQLTGGGAPRQVNDTQIEI